MVSPESLNPDHETDVHSGVVYAGAIGGNTLREVASINYIPAPGGHVGFRAGELLDALRGVYPDEQFWVPTTAIVRQTVEPPEASSPSVFSYYDGGLVINADRREVVVDGTVSSPPVVVFNLFHYFAQNSEKVLKRYELYEKCWPDASSRYGQREQTVDVHIYRARRHFGRYRASIVTVRSVGYMFDPMQAIEQPPES